MVSKYLRANSGESLVISTKDDKLKINVGGSLVCNEPTVKLFRMTVDSKLSFEPHLSTVCKKVSHKLHALARVSD